MGVTTKAMLAYGYRLKTENDGWLVHDDSPGLAEEYDDESGMDRLLADAGFPINDHRTPDYYQRRREAVQQLGVQFEYSGYEAEDLLLVASGSVYEAHLGDAALITPGGMLVQAGAVADERLRRALEALELRPVQESAAWLLTSYRF